MPASFSNKGTKPRLISPAAASVSERMTNGAFEIDLVSLADAILADADFTDADFTDADCKPRQDDVMGRCSDSVADAKSRLAYVDESYSDDR